uniref:Uncharacterized protein n=1 Tax=Rhizophora mucronata TaxID=61149 RepID=A0A2P2QZZ4_RHIMU
MIVSTIGKASQYQAICLRIQYHLLLTFGK